MKAMVVRLGFPFRVILAIVVFCGWCLPALANEADDAIARLAGQARAQASAHAGEDVKRTLAEISANIPKASLQGVATANALLAELSRAIANDTGASDSGTTPDRPPAASPTPEGPPAGQPSAVAPTRPAMSPSMRALMQQQGDLALRNGDISGARRFYQKGAEGGCAACADALANTFSAEWLTQSGAVGIKPDQTQSDVWRALARQLTQATNQ